MARCRSRALRNPARSTRGRFSLSPARLLDQSTQVGEQHMSSGIRNGWSFSLCQIHLSDVCWFHGSTRLAPSLRHWLYRRGPLHHLAIFDIDSSLAGEYSVCAFDNKEEVWSRFRVDVRQTRRAEHPPELVRRQSCFKKLILCFQVIHPASGEREWGAGSSFLCQAAGYPEPRSGLLP